MAVPTDTELRSLLEKFVCVRLVQMWGVDLNHFQFDYGMTWAVFFQNADGTIYGRYGTRSALRDDSTRDISLAGFKRSIEGALELHERFSADGDATIRELMGKQARFAPQWPQPELIPRLAANDQLARKFTGLADERNLRAHGVGCIHCHMVPDNELLSLRRAGLPIAERLIWPYPMPGAVGLQMDPDQRGTVRRVREESAAAEAGVQAGDEIVRFDGQTILSTADIQWVLHNAPTAGSIPLAVVRDGETHELTLLLAENWRRHLGDWRFTNLGVCMQIAGFNGRPGRGGGAALAIQIQRVHPKRMAELDLKANDVILAIDGRREPMNLGQLTEYLLSKTPGSEIEVVRRRPGTDGARTVRWKIE